MVSNNQDNRKYSGRIAPGIGRIFGWAFMGLVFVCLFALVFGFVVKWLWNMLMPVIFGLGEITFWQAFALVILTKLLFGGFGPHRKDWKPRPAWDHHDWHRPWNRSGREHTSIKSKINDWKYYHRFWEDEGQEAFKSYIERKEKDKEETSAEEP